MPLDDIDSIFARPTLGHHKNFRFFNPVHGKAMFNAHSALSAEGTTVEHAVKKANDLLQNGENPDLIRHALGIFLTHSKDSQERRIIVPPLKKHALFRATAIPTAVATDDATDSATAIPSAIHGSEVVTLDIFRSAAVVSYWREDYGLNDHHTHWHNVFPYTGINGDLDKPIRTIDRQGELFFHMHHQMVARYEAELLSWNQPFLNSWDNYGNKVEFESVPIPLLSDKYGRYGSYRKWYTTNNPDIIDDPPVSIAKMEGWRDSINIAIEEKSLYTITKDGKSGRVELNDDNVANLIGIIVEAEAKELQILPDGSTLDTERYGSLHNFGHDKFAELSYQKNKPIYGLMTSPTVAVRDHSFWMWHKHIDGFFRKIGNKFPHSIQANKAEITLSNLSIKPQSKDALHYPDITTVLGPPSIEHLESKAKLDHEPYEWSIDILSTRIPAPSTDNPQIITLRFFIVVKKSMEDYSRWIEMDKYTVTINSAESVTNLRLDKDSTVARKVSKYEDNSNLSPWCRCGFPPNLMLPVGQPDGMSFVAFCMATDDKLDPGKPHSLSFCGSMKEDRKYPDPRSMGYPFNRIWFEDVYSNKDITIENIIKNHTEYPFMTTYEFKIFRTTKHYLDDDVGSSLDVRKPDE